MPVRVYTVHVKDLYSSQVVEWSGTASTDLDARQRAQARAFEVFGNHGAVVGNIELGVGAEPKPETTRTFRTQHNYMTNEDEEVPAILLPQDKRIQRTVMTVVNKLAPPELADPVVPSTATEPGRKVAGAKAPKFL